MKKLLYYPLIALIPLLQSCVVDPETGQMKAGWLFWVFLGIILGLAFIGVLVSSMRKKKPEDAPSLAEQEMEAYEETLEKKLEESEPKDSEENKES